MSRRFSTVKHFSFLLSTVFVLMSFVAWSNLNVKQAHASNEAVNVVLTTTDQNNKLTPKNGINFSSGASSQGQIIGVDENTKYQQMTGFGASLNDASVWEMENKLSQSQRDALMQTFFSPTNGIGISLLRQPIGQSDLNAPGYQAPGQYCSYDDNSGNPDNNLSNFSIQHDIDSHVIDLIHQAKQLNSQLKVIATTWCVPQWMLQSSGGINNSSTMNSNYYQTYANYLVKYIQAYGAQNIPIWAITPQNEPVGGANFGDNISADQENVLIRDHIGPDFTNNNISSKILVLDHDWGYTQYAETILGDPVTNPYVTGTAWHRYTGDISGQTVVHNAYPAKGTFFTEDSPPQNNTDWPTYMPTLAPRTIDILRHWSSTYIQWTMALNTSFRPGSCGNCGAMVYVDDATGNITYTLDYYILGHISKYVQPGAYRIGTNDTTSSGLDNVAFQNPDGSKVLIAYNGNSSSQSFGVNWGNENFSYTLPAQGIVTFTWSGTQAGNTPGAPLNRNGWIASASSGSGSDAPGNAIDGDRATRWSTDASQTPGQYFQVDLGSAQTFNEATIDLGSNTYDYPQHYQVYVSQDGTNWGSPIASGNGSSTLMQISFPTQTARYIRIVQTGSSNAWFSIAEFNLYNNASGGGQPGQQLFFDDFENGSSSQWTPYDGSWSVCQVGNNSKEYCASNTSEDISLAGSTSWSNYNVQSYVVAGNNGNNGVCLLGRVQDGNHFYQAELKTNNSWDIWKNNGGSWSQIASGNFNWSGNSYYLIRLDLNGSTLTMSYSTDYGSSWNTLGSGNDSTWSSGQIGVRVWGTTGRFDQVKVISD